MSETSLLVHSDFWVRDVRFRMEVALWDCIAGRQCHPRPCSWRPPPLPGTQEMHTYFPQRSAPVAWHDKYVLTPINGTFILHPVLLSHTKIYRAVLKYQYSTHMPHVIAYIYLQWYVPICAISELIAWEQWFSRQLTNIAAITSVEQTSYIFEES